MILFWLAAAAISAAAAALTLRSAARASGPAAQGGRIALLACMAAPLLAAGLYLLVGTPGVPDQAHAARVAEWRRAPESLGPSEAAAVLQKIVKTRPGDPVAHTQLGRARLAEGDALAAVRSFQRAAELAPRDPESWTALAQALLSLEPASTPEARRALAQAQALAPADPEVRYWLGRSDIVDGEPGRGLAQWRALAASLPPTDPRRAALLNEIAAVESPPPTDAAITAMVDGLAARLRAQPDDPAGWARLARAYGVLGREAELEAALAEARRLFTDRPDALAAVEAAAAEGRARSPLRAGA